MTTSSGTKMVLLLDTDSHLNGTIGQWLDQNGYATTLADDVCQVFEELSDYTVRMNPDVVLLQVPSLSDCFEDLQHAIRLSANQSDLKVVGLSERKNKLSRKRYFASDLDQLQSIMHREVPCAA